jgi:HSP20 family molecular chaperone IbpA
VFDSPFLLGFERMQSLIDSAARGAGDAYPPYNVEAPEDGRLVISVAVAGFSRDDLDVSVEGRQLVVRGEQAGKEESARAFIHRGIAARRFQRSFVLADGWTVDGAELRDGLLHIRLSRLEPEQRVRRIAIEGDRNG